MNRATAIAIILTLLAVTGVSSAAQWNVNDLTEIQSQGGFNTDNVLGDSQFSHGGQYLFVTNYGDGRVYRYGLSDPYDLTTASGVQQSFAFADIPAVVFRQEGDTMYIADDGNMVVNQYPLSPSYDLDSATQPPAETCDVSGIGSRLFSLEISQNGEHMYVGNGNGDVYHYTIDDYDVSTCVQQSNFNPTGGDVIAIAINDTGSGLMTGGSAGNLVMHNLSTPYNLTTQSESNSRSFSGDVLAIQNYRGESEVLIQEDDTLRRFSWFQNEVSGHILESDGTPIGGATVTVNTSSQSIESGPDGSYTIHVDDGTHEIEASKVEYVTNSTTVQVSSDVQNVNITLFKEAQLELDIRGYMDHGSTQGYIVTANESGTDVDVTSQATVTSSNSTVVSVDQTDNELIATSDVTINDVSTITAEYQGHTVSKDVTVANRTIDNIGIMPSPQWIPTILGIDESGTGPGGIGSEMQWLLILIMIMYGVTYQTNSASVGIGIGVGGVIVLWVSGYVSVGMLLSTMLFGAFIALTTLDLQNDQTVVHEYR